MNCRPRRLPTAIPLVAASALTAAAQSFPGLPGDKTLVVWATPAHLTQRGGSVLTLDDRQSHFDGIVFGEIAPGRWMAGSDFHRRTRPDQEAVPAETAGPGTLVQLAITYRGREVSVFRNGVLVSRHEIPEAQAFSRDSAVVIGLRHLESGDGACFAGAIDDARIYGSALTPEQLAVLRPNQPSEPRPVAWWNFENGRAEDVQGVFPPAQL
ncbi:MAG: LamG-like jellyroll fold domain-containing protein, partial [Verrucomicrobiota bacterium]